jgi:hypothetical protein
MGVTRMKFLATMLVAVFVVVASASLVFANCAGHTKAQLAKNGTSTSSDRVTTADVPPPPVGDQVVQSVQTDKGFEKK